MNMVREKLLEGKMQMQMLFWKEAGLNNISWVLQMDWIILFFHLHLFMWLFIFTSIIYLIYFALYGFYILPLHLQQTKF